MAWTVAVSFFQNPSLDRESNTHLTFWPSRTVKRVRIRFENIWYIAVMITEISTELSSSNS
jgi:hypothetical protein